VFNSAVLDSLLDWKKVVLLGTMLLELVSSVFGMENCIDFRKELVLSRTTLLELVFSVIGMLVAIEFRKKVFLLAMTWLELASSALKAPYLDDMTFLR